MYQRPAGPAVAAPVAAAVAAFTSRSRLIVPVVFDEQILRPLRAARGLAEPAFIKPPNDQSFPARVWRGAELPEGYDEESPVLVAEVVTWEKEFRCFVLDRRPRTISVYSRQGELQREQGFAAEAAELVEAEAAVVALCVDPAVDLPRAAVLDVGVIAGRGWAVVEQIAASGAGINGDVLLACGRAPPECPRTPSATGDLLETR